VSADRQCGTAVHAVQTVGSVALRQYPDSHCPQNELLAVVQVSATLQWSTSVHAGQLSAGPSTR
jgi:hypothetical protein